jgi:hypothetical protein
MCGAEQILSEVKRLMESEDFIARHKTREDAFTRTRKLSAQDIIRFVLGLKGTTQPFEIARYFSETKQTPVSAGSMTKARTKLSWSAFGELLRLSGEIVPTPCRFQGYRLIAFDGMQGDLPRTEELLAKYPPEKGVRIPKFHAVSAYDVLNKIFLDAVFLPAPCDEREAALSFIRSLSLSADDIVTFDRGFPSIRLIQTLEEMGISYVIRVNRSFITEVRDFIESDVADEIIDVHYTKRRAAASKVQCKTPWDSSIRVVKIPLPNGDEEILLTSLTHLPKDDLAGIYRLRWGIETGHNHLKNAIQIETFMGTLENSIKQEFYADLFVYNITSLLCAQAQGLQEKKIQIQAGNLP